MKARIQAPKGLDATGRAAFRRAVAAIERTDRDPLEFRDAVERFARATQDAAEVRRVWRELGKPWLAAGGATGQSDVPHPLVRMIQDADKLAEAYGRALGLDPTPAKAMGRPVGAVSAPDRAAAPPRVTAKADALRLVK